MSSCMEPSTDAAPYLRHSCFTRSAPMALAANWALKSPSVWSGTRTLASSRRSKVPPCQSRLRLNLSGGSSRPSW